jgi:hypothetical protein
MPKSYPDVTQSGAASAEVQEEGRKLTSPASPGLTPQLSPNSNTNLVGLCLDLCFSSSYSSMRCLAQFIAQIGWWLQEGVLVGEGELQCPARRCGGISRCGWPCDFHRL